MALLTGLGDSGRFNNKKVYHLLTRVAYCQCMVRKVFAEFFVRFQWTDIVMIVEDEHVYYQILGNSIEEGLREKQELFPFRINVYGSKEINYKSILQEASLRARSKIFDKSFNNNSCYKYSCRYRCLQ